jgi:putative N6-adenine-specific DNA methylase
MTASPILVTCAKGIVPFLTREIRDLGFPVLGELPAGVETQGTLDDTLRLNLCLRTGQRVLLEVGRFRAVDPDALYAAIRALPWETWLDERGYVSVASWVRTETVRDTRFANLKCKDAIVDRIREKTGRRPDSGSSREGAVVFCYWQGASCRLYLDTSGEALAWRGYRKIPLRAPMQETLAAGVVLATGWRGETHFVNPMCGSGTLAIEAALLALNRPPGLLRENFGFMHIRGWNADLWQTLREKAKRNIRKDLPLRIVASDIEPRAVDAARRNAETAGVAQRIEFHVCDFAETPVPPGAGAVILNPEYGERMGTESALEPLYRRIGDFFKKNCQGYTGFVFTGNEALGKKIGLRSNRRLTFFNSGIECRLLRFDLYAGTRRGKNRDPATP